MKKWLYLTLILVLVFGMVSCGGGGDSSSLTASLFVTNNSSFDCYIYFDGAQLLFLGRLGGQGTITNISVGFEHSVVANNPFGQWVASTEWRTTEAITYTWTFYDHLD